MWVTPLMQPVFDVVTCVLYLLVVDWASARLGTTGTLMCWIASTFLSFLSYLYYTSLLNTTTATKIHKHNCTRLGQEVHSLSLSLSEKIGTDS